jgi:hypothetical protein
MMTALLRRLLPVLVLLSLGASLSACGVWRGTNDVSTDYGADAMGKGPGLITGKSGGVVIYQK